MQKTANVTKGGYRHPRAEKSRLESGLGTAMVIFIKFLLDHLRLKTYSLARCEPFVHTACALEFVDFDFPTWVNATRMRGGE